MRLQRCVSYHADKALAGTSFLDQEYPVTDGNRTLESPEQKPVDAIVRDTNSWYALLYFFLNKFGNQSMRYECFRIRWSSHPSEQWHLALKQFIHGQPDRLLTGLGRYLWPRHVVANMRDAGIGIWWWFHLYDCGVSSIMGSRNVEIVPVKLLWWNENRVEELQPPENRFDLNYLQLHRSQNPLKSPLRTACIQASFGDMWNQRWRCVSAFNETAKGAKEQVNL